MNRDTPIGSFWFWLIFRLASVLILFLAPLVIFTSPESSRSVRYIFVGIIWSVILVGNDDLIYGFASEGGIFYRRYFRFQFLPWEQVAAIRWSSSTRITFELKKRAFARQALSAQSVGAPAKSESFSTPPELIKWLRVAKPLGSSGIELEGPGL